MSRRVPPFVRDLYPQSPIAIIGAAGPWIGEETRRSLPPHVYKYYLARTRNYRRQSLKVSEKYTQNITPSGFYTRLQ